eukprot:6186311-Pleurochrysis_carterae.AAC.1
MSKSIEDPRARFDQSETVSDWILILPRRSYWLARFCTVLPRRITSNSSRMRPSGCKRCAALTKLGSR